MNRGLVTMHTGCAADPEAASRLPWTGPGGRSFRQNSCVTSVTQGLVINMFIMPLDGGGGPVTT